MADLGQSGGRVEVLMEDGTWERGELIRERHTGARHDALILGPHGITSWHYRDQDDGEPDEWRRS
jgi:hypothetical protein